MNVFLKILRVLIPGVAVLLLVVQVVVSNELATLGKRMGQLDAAVSEEQDIHEVLETQVASASSLLTLRDKALSLGFREPTVSQIVALSPEVPVAFGVNKIRL